MTTPCTTIEQAREAAAAGYPEYLVDTHGRQHECIARRNILAGNWDNGFIVRQYLTGEFAREREG